MARSDSSFSSLKLKNPAKEDILRSLLVQERDLRTSSETQEKMRVAEETVDREWMDVVADIQEQLVSKHNQSTQDSSLRVTETELRVAARRHPDICFWVKFNRARKGDLQVGQTAPNMTMRWAKDCNKVPLIDPSNQQRTVLFAGSFS